MYCYLYGKHFDNICFVSAFHSIRENCLIFVQCISRMKVPCVGRKRCKDSSFLVTSELVVAHAPIISRFVSPSFYLYPARNIFFCVFQRKTLSGFISTRRLVQGISCPCCTHQFEKILLIVPFTARDFSFILYHRWNIFIMCYFRYIYIYYAYIICSIYM